MASSIRTIGVIPTPEYREALLGDGPCGGRAPALVLFPADGRGIGQRWCEMRDRAAFGEGDRMALPLLWQGQPVPMGIALAVWTLADQEDPTPAGWLFTDILNAHDDTIVHELAALADALETVSIAAEVIIEHYPEDGGDDAE